MDVAARSEKLAAARWRGERKRTVPTKRTAAAVGRGSGDLTNAPRCQVVPARSGVVRRRRCRLAAHQFVGMVLRLRCCWFWDGLVCAARCCLAGWVGVWSCGTWKLFWEWVDGLARLFVITVYIRLSIDQVTTKAWKVSRFGSFARQDPLQLPLHGHRHGGFAPAAYADHRPRITLLGVLKLIFVSRFLRRKLSRDYF